MDVFTLSPSVSAAMRKMPVGRALPLCIAMTLSGIQTLQTKVESLLTNSSSGKYFSRS